MLTTDGSAASTALTMAVRNFSRPLATVVYCQMRQDYDPATFEVDHVVPEKMDGTTALENLALACFKCNTKQVGFGG